MERESTPAKPSAVEDAHDTTGQLHSGAFRTSFRSVAVKFNPDASSEATATKEGQVPPAARHSASSSDEDSIGGEETAKPKVAEEPTGFEDWESISTARSSEPEVALDEGGNIRSASVQSVRRFTFFPRYIEDAVTRFVDETCEIHMVGRKQWLQYSAPLARLGSSARHNERQNVRLDGTKGAQRWTGGGLSTASRPASDSQIAKGGKLLEYFRGALPRAHETPLPIPQGLFSELRYGRVAAPRRTTPVKSPYK
jgi:hypothetical protein